VGLKSGGGGGGEGGCLVLRAARGEGGGGGRTKRIGLSGRRASRSWTWDRGGSRRRKVLALRYSLEETARGGYTHVTGVR
jgi:hypothetical protein